MDELLEPRSISSIILLAITIFLIIIIILRRKLNSSSRHYSQPPGPWKLPIIGNLHQMMDPLPHHRLRHLAAKYGPLMHLQLGETSTIVVSSPELAKLFLQTHDLDFAARPYLPSTSIIYGPRDVLFAAYGDYWKQMKKICVRELLSAARVKSLEPVRREVANELVGLIRAGGGRSRCAVNLSRMVHSAANSIIWRTAFGKRIQKQEEAFFPVQQELLKAAGGFSLMDVFPSSNLVRLLSGTESRLKRLRGEADVIMELIIDDHITRRSEATGSEEDLVDVLLSLADNSSNNLTFPITNVEIKAVIFDIFLAGSDTSATTIEWAMSELMKNPRAMKKVQKEVRDAFDGKGRIDDEEELDRLHYLKLVVKETFRLHPAGPIIPREARETVVIDGKYRIPSKTRVVINAWAIGRDPCHWDEPEEFRPERFQDSPIHYKGLDFALIPFGSGRRICPGTDFATAVVSLMLANLLYHFDWELPDGVAPRDLDMSEEFGITVRRKTDLVMKPVPYYPNVVP